MSKAGSAGVSPAWPAGPQRAGTGWRSRGYLPHFDEHGLVQMITFRLADALPASKLDDLEHHPRNLTDASRRRRLETYLDAGHGACYLKDERVAHMVGTALMHFDGLRYRLLAWVIMPNHVHVLVETVPGYALAGIVHSWKSFTSKEGNKILKRAGTFWQVEYHDRAIRDARHPDAAIQYIENNPVKAGMVRQAEEWPYGSAAMRMRKNDLGAQASRLQRRRAPPLEERSGASTIRANAAASRPCRRDACAPSIETNDG